MPLGNETNAPGIRELAENGKMIYRQLIENNILNEADLPGKVVAIEIISRDYFIGTSVEDAYIKAKVKYPNSVFHFVHIGYSEKHARIRCVGMNGYGITTIVQSTASLPTTQA